MRNQIIVRFSLSAIRGAESIPMVCVFCIFISVNWCYRQGIIGGHPCLWVRWFNRLSNFGESVGGKSSALRRLVISYFAFYIWCGAIFFHIVMVPYQRLDLIHRHKRKAWEPPAVCPTLWGLRIARYCRTDNARAHADMNIYAATWSSWNLYAKITHRYNTPLAVI